jgi:hypothetical protein
VSAGRLRRRCAHAQLWLYPTGWRRRYGEEVGGLIDDDPPTARGLLSLLAGAADAHLRPRETWLCGVHAETRVRLSVQALFYCWIALSVAGIAYWKETEEAAFAAAARHHPVLAVAADAILAGALLGAVAIAIGGLPLLWEALRTALRGRDRRLVGALALAPAALTAFALVTAALVLAVSSTEVSSAATAVKLAVLVPWWTAGLACALCCALAPRLVLARARPSARSLRRAATAGRLLVGAMVLVSAGLLVYDVALVALAPHLAGESGGPIWPSTGLTLAAFAAVAAISTGLGLLAGTRASRAARGA